MKTIFISCLAPALLSMLIVLNVFGQKADYKNEPGYDFYSNETGKVFPSFDGTADNTESGNISEKILKRFKRKFNAAIDVRWEQYGDNYLAIFSTGETSTRSLFDNRGRQIYTINYSTETQLPADVKNLVSDKYEDYRITSVAEVLQDDRKIWVVKLAGKGDYITARVEDGELEEVENFQK